MTTTVTRGAGRPAAAARKAKHDQRNVKTGPNPTTAVIESIVDASRASRAAEAERAEAVQTVKQDAYGRMSVDELKARAKMLQIKPLPRTKGALLTAILGAERDLAAGEERAAEYAQANAEQDLIPQDADSPGGEYVPDPPAGSNAPETEGLDPKGAAKAGRIGNELEPHGWAMQVNGHGPRVTAILTRGQEAITVTWDAGVFNYDETAHAIGDRVTKVRNVSAAIKLGARSSTEAEKDLERVVRNRTFNKSKVAEAGEPRRARLPFDPETVTEAELSALLSGKTVEWTNRITRGTETAKVNDRSAKFFKIADGPAGRTLHFTSPEGFRACRLADILRVGGSLRKRAQAKVAA